MSPSEIGANKINIEWVRPAIFKVIHFKCWFVNIVPMDKGASRVSMVTSILPQAGNLPNIKQVIISINCNGFLEIMLYKQEGPYLYGILERVEPKSNIVSMFCHHQVQHADLWNLQSISMCQVSDSSRWLCQVGLIQPFTENKNEVQGNGSTCPIPPSTTHTPSLSRHRVRGLWNQRQKYL